MSLNPVGKALYLSASLRKQAEKAGKAGLQLQAEVFVRRANLYAQQAEEEAHRQVVAWQAKRSRA